MYKRYFDNIDFDDLYNIIKPKTINNKCLSLKYYEDYSILETICHMIISTEPHTIYENRKYHSIYTYIGNKDINTIIYHEMEFSECDFCQIEIINNNNMYAYFLEDENMLVGTCNDCMLDMIIFADNQIKEIIDNILLKLLLLKESPILHDLNLDVFNYIFKMII